MRRPRHLSPEDKAIWDHYRRHVDPLDRQSAPASGSGPAPAAAPKPREKPVSRPAPAPDPLPRFQIGEVAEPRRNSTAIPARPALRMDHKAHKRMTRGKVKPEARIDLHGMTLDVAYHELRAFILGAQERDRRLVLVITGKGRGQGGPGEAGALRRQVPMWLAQVPLKSVVLQVESAHQRHGGAGALYVYLRKRR